MNDSSIAMPEFIVLDASVILELRPPIQNPPHPNHVAANSFLNRLRPFAATGNSMPILPLLAFEEICFKLCQQVIVSKLKANNSSMYWHHYYKNNPQIINSCIPVLEKFHKILTSFPILITEPEDISVTPRGTEKGLAERMIDIMTSFNLLPKDANIISEAERLGIHNLASLDKDWERASGFNVFTVV